MKLNTQWLAVMRAAKSKELKKEIEILSQTFGRIIDRKDTVIKASTKDIEEAEEQYNMALRSFLEAIEKMISKIFLFDFVIFLLFCFSHLKRITHFDHR